MSADVQETTTEAMIDFNRVDVWIGRLSQLIRAAEELRVRARAVLSAIPKRKTNKLSSPEADYSAPERMQVLALMRTLKHFGNFTRFIASRYTVGILPPKRKLNPGTAAEAHLLRDMLNHLSTDLALIEAAIAQRERSYSPLQGNSHSIDYYQKFSKDLIHDLEQFDLSQLKDRTHVKLARLVNNYASRLSVRTKQAEMLLSADILARETFGYVKKYVQHNVQTGPSEGVKRVPFSIEVVTYFTESTRVRILPYYPDIVLVGLPFATGHFQKDQLQDAFYKDRAFEPKTDPVLGQSEKDGLPFEAILPWELLVIPHEIGHYVYWNGCTLNDKGEVGKPFEEALLDHLTATEGEDALGLTTCDWRIHWLEELFCDVLNCLILGPLAVLGLQAIIADAAPNTLFHGNGAHPLGGIRPFIATHILQRAFPDKYPNAIEQLDKQWNHYLEVVGKAKKLKKEIKIGKRRKKVTFGCWGDHRYRDHKKTFDRVRKVSLSKDELLQQLNPVIDAILAVLRPLDSPLGITKQTLPPSDIEAAGHLTDYHDTLQNLTKWRTKRIRRFRFNKRLIRYSKTKMLNEIKSRSDKELVEHLQTHFLAVWGDKGPEGGHVF